MIGTPWRSGQRYVPIVFSGIWRDRTSRGCGDFYSWFAAIEVMVVGAAVWCSAGEGIVGRIGDRGGIESRGCCMGVVQIVGDSVGGGKG
jgi:hypothetical protein